jgi:hypothetical protein
LRTLAPRGSFEAMLGTIVGGSQMGNPQTGEKQFTFDQIDLDAGAVARVRMKFLGHGFTQDPGDLRRAAVFEKKGLGGCIVDLAAGVVTDVIEPSTGCAFYGHGLFSKDGSKIYVVEAELASKAGRLTVRDAKTLRSLGELGTFGSSPHDCLLVDDKRTLVVTNGGGDFGGSDAPSVVFVDVESGKLHERITLTNPRLNAGHVAVTSDGSIAVVSAPRQGLPEETSQGGLSLRPAGGQMLSVKQPSDVTRAMIGESLSVAVHEPSGIALVTNPKGALVTFWHMAERRLVKTMKIVSPRGVTLTKDGRWFVLGCKLEAEVVLVSTESLEPAPDKGYGSWLVSGSHVYLREEWA